MTFVRFNGNISVPARQNSPPGPPPARIGAAGTKDALDSPSNLRYALMPGSVRVVRERHDGIGFSQPLWDRFGKADRRNNLLCRFVATWDLLSS
jgi:hypothetical protein